jgi:membrane fusion protein, multidrug efflux system
VVVPPPAVQSGQQGRFVYVVQPDGTAVATPVKTSRNYEQFAVIDSGVAPGKSVIIDGQERVVPNARVNIVRTVQTAPSSAAKENAANSGAPE